MTLFSSPIVLVLVGVIGLLIGLLIGFLFIDRDSRKSKSAGIPEEFSRDGFSEIARMLYSPSKKRIVSSLDGEYYREAGELNPDQHARLTKVLRIWNDWNNVPGAGTAAAEAATVESLEQPKPEEEEAAAVGIPAAAIASEAEIEKPLEEKPFEEEPGIPPAEETIFSTDDTPAFQPVTPAPFVEDIAAPEIPIEEPAAEAPAVEVKNQTIVEQINQTLQGMLAGTPYEYRGLTLQDDQQNGVLVFAGSEKFNGIDAVPYPDAQELIRNAVTEWERKYESEQNKPG